jgi:hypothetical protein
MGKWQLLGGGEFPGLKGGSMVDLVLSASCSSDPIQVRY